MENAAAYGPAPIDAPEIYPGRWPDGAVRVSKDAVTSLPWPLDTRHTRGRRPQLAIGSNACPAQLIRKNLTGTILLSPVTLRNHLVVYARHTTRYGAVPATVMRWPGAHSRVFITWLTDAQQVQLDLSENANYLRVSLPTDQGVISGYRAVTGVFRGPAKSPIRLASVMTTGSSLPPGMSQTELWTMRASAVG